jgi:hypothetical protein
MAVGQILGNVGGSLIPKLAGEGTVRILGQEVAKKTAAQVVGGGTVFLAGKGLLDIVSPNQPGYTG